ncbi:alpha/beta fold hydrolase [Zavarzinella formosa]|uniref:alpha/beta fold hydrolase n=1 Tax=Zavarzinella formosa TaxID=360055 RepID=UPI0002F392B3|nr:alpha/beta hydrolase [Zavarzinella formosa]
MREELFANSNIARFPSDGPPLILWHGLGRCWRDFSTLLPWLTPRWSVTAIDHRGHGQSARTPGAYHVPDYVADAVRLLKTFNNGPTVLYGHSLGALVAMGVAAECPELVRGIVLEDPPSAQMLVGISETGYAVTWRVMQQLAGNRDIVHSVRALSETIMPNGKRLGELRNPAALRFLASCLADLDPETMTTPIAGTWLHGYDPVATAADVRCPALLLAADPAAGGMMSAEASSSLASSFKEGYLVNFPGCGHLLHGEHPEAVAKVVLPFLESLS